MGLRKLMVVLVAAAVLLPAGVGLLVTAGSSPPARAPEHLQAAARLAARLVAEDLTHTLSLFKTGGQLFELPVLSRQETTGVLRLLYKQDLDLRQVVLLNGENRPVVEPVFLGPDQLDEQQDMAGRLPVDAAALERFLNRIPLATVRSNQQALSDPYSERGINAVLVTGAVALPTEAGSRPWVLAFERNLQRLQRLLSLAASGAGARAFLVDGGGRVVVHPDGRIMLQRRSLPDHPLVKRFLSGATGGAACWPDAGQSRRCGAFRRLEFPGWAVVLEEPETAPPGRRLGWWAYPLWGGVAVVLLLLALLVERRTVRLLGEMEALRLSAENRAEQLKRLQASLLESGKLSAIGDLGAGVAHEFNNPLGGILGLVQLLLRKKKDDDPDRSFLQRIEQEARRCKAITENLLRFSEQQGLEHREPVRLERVVEAALDLVRAKFTKQHIEISTEFAPDTPRVLGQEGQLQRALLNLLFNAATAMPEGGILRIQLDRAGEQVRLRLADSGAGIAPENLDRVFEPFFTTKANWRGAGLGLTEVYQIVRAHGGEISLRSELGQGTEVTILLPAASGRAAAPGLLE